MAVYDEDLLIGLSVLEDQTLVRDEAILLHPAALGSLDVVIAEDHMEPPLLIEPMQQVKGTPMRTLHGAELPILPQLVAVAHLDVGKPVAVIVPQHVKEQIFVPHEGIRPAVIATVEIAEEDQAGAIVEQNASGGVKRLRHPPVRPQAHAVA
jgi:hypothetical protein